MELNILDILNRVYGPKGLPFPQRPRTTEGNAVVSEDEFDHPLIEKGSDMGSLGSPIRKNVEGYLGRYVFMPVTVVYGNTEYELPNAVIVITGEKEIVETLLYGVLDKSGKAVGGTVFEKAFNKPYDISIITTLVGKGSSWPEEELKKVIELWRYDDLLTIKCALTDLYLQPKNNFLFKRIAHMDVQGSENVEVIQIDGRSNIDFELELK